MPCPFNACGDTLVRSLPNFFDPGRIERITHTFFAESINPVCRRDSADSCGDAESHAVA